MVVGVSRPDDARSWSEVEKSGFEGERSCLWSVVGVLEVSLWSLEGESLGS
jgi:hypothetical protein